MVVARPQRPDQPRQVLRCVDAHPVPRVQEDDDGDGTPVLVQFQLRNDYALEVFNGDLGTVVGIDPVEQKLRVSLDDGRDVRYPIASLYQLTHAYAMSVHKAQGRSSRRWWCRC